MRIAMIVVGLLWVGCGSSAASGGGMGQLRSASNPPASSAQWQRTVIEGEVFSFELPGPAEINVQRDETPGIEPITRTTHKAQSSGLRATFMMNGRERLVGMSDAEIFQFYFESLMVSSAGQNASGGGEVQLPELALPSKTWRIDTASQHQTVVVRVVIAPERIYELIATVDTNVPTALRDAQHFIESARIEQ